MSLFSDPRNILSVVGALAILYFVVYKVYPFLYWYYAYTCRAAKNLKAYGEWAVVTGGTDGIGKAYCIEFAERGINCLIISRNQAKCEAVEKELQAKYPKVQFSHLAIDFGNFDAKAREAVRTKVEGLDVGILMNNVGYGGSSPKYFFENPDKEMTDQVDININSTIWMTKIILGDEKQGMIARKRGAIVMIGSQAGCWNTPLISCYGAAKAYITSFSKSLHAEMADYNIHVSVQTPGRVLSNMTSKFGQESTDFPNAATWVKSAIRFIGYDSHTSGYRPHGYGRWRALLLPEAAWNKFWMDMHKGIRETVLKADESTSKKEAAVEIPLVSVKGQPSNPGMD